MYQHQTIKTSLELAFLKSCLTRAMAVKTLELIQSMDAMRERYNLAITLKIKALLDKEPKIKPYLTRSDDTFVELNDRAKIANDLNADMFISFHANSASNGTVSGSETYYNRDNSKSLADTYT